MSDTQTLKASPSKVPSVNRTQNALKNSTKEKTQFSILKANEIFLDAWSKIPDQSLPISQQLPQYFQNKLWFRENSVPITKCQTGPLCMSSVPAIPSKKTFSLPLKQSKSPYSSPREEKSKLDHSRVEVNDNNNSEEASPKTGVVHPKIPEYPNSVHLPNYGFVSRQERSKSTLEKIMRKRVTESERYKNGSTDLRVSESLWDCNTNFMMARLQPIAHRGQQRLRDTKTPQNLGFQERFIVGKASFEVNIPNRVTFVSGFRRKPNNLTYRDMKILPLPTPKRGGFKMAKSELTQKIVGPGSFMIKNHWKPDSSIGL